jgi:tape measure domain-containing protein
MSSFNAEFRVEDGQARQSIKELKKGIKGLTEAFEEAEIGGKDFIEAASDLSGLQKELKDARSEIVNIDKAYGDLNKALDSVGEAYNKAERNAAEYHANLLKLAKNQLKDQDRLRDKNFQAEVDDFDRRLKLASAAASKMSAQQRAIMEFRAGMGAKGAIPAIASPIRGTIEQGPLEASGGFPATAGSPAYREYIRKAAKESQDALKEVAATANEIAPNPKAFLPGSLASYEAKLKRLKNEARLISPDSTRWQVLNKQILEAERGIAKINKRQRLGPTRRQRLGAAGGAFLYGGGMGGGFGSAAGGIAGGLMGGPAGAFTGAAIGQAVDNLTAMAGAMAEQSAAVRRLQSGLASASTSLQDYALASQEVDRISNRLLIPIDEATRKFTQLRASTVALGIDTKTTGELFEGTAAAVLQSGGSMDDVSGAMRAVVQVFSKGKLTAEELRGQLAERLPGAVVDFARISGKSLQQIDQEFEAGEATLDDFVKFLKSKKDDTSNYVDEMATSSEFAGARMNKAFESLRINIGNSLQPTGAAIQDFATNSIRVLDALIRKAIESKLIQPGPDFLESEALAGRQGGVAGLEERLLQTSELEGKLRKTADSMGLGFLIDFSKPLQTAAKEAKKLEEALVSIRKKENLTKKVAKQLQDEEKKAKKDQTAAGLLGAIEKREEAILGARKRREEDIAQIRKKAVEDAKRIEEDFNRQRLEKEREIGAIRRELAGVKTDTGFALEAANVAASGGDPGIIRNQQVLAEASRRRNEEKIQAEQQILDEQTARTKAIEDLKFQTADAINKANTRYTKAIGEAQEGYARSVAKIIDEGTGKAGKRLAAAGRLAAAYLSQATAKEAFSAATGKSIISAGDNYMVDEQIYSKEALISAAGATSKPAGNAARDFVKSTGEIQKATQALNILSAGTSSSSNYTAQFSVSVTDLTNKLGGQNRALEALGRTSRAVSEELADAEYFKTFVELGTKEIEEMAGAMKNLKTELEKGTGVRYFRQKGMKPEQAEQAYTLTRDYTDRLTRVSATARAAMAEAEEAGKPEQAAEILETYKGIAQTMRSSYDSAMLFSQAINNLPIEIRLEDSIQDIGDKLSDLMDPVNQIKGAAGAIGDAFGTAFKGVIAGSMTAQEALAGMFRSISDHFADMVAQMIAEYLKMQLIEGIMNIFSMLAPGFGTGIAPGPVAKSAGVKFSATKMGPAFANGGVASGGFTAFANGGMVTGPTLGLVGEGRYNEAIIPLPDGKSVPVQLSGSAGGNTAPINTSIVVNVKNGQAESQMSGNQGNQLARELEGAVRQVILKESRPGGLISSSR